MAIQYVGGVSANSASASYSLSLTSLTGGIASSPASTDLVVVITGFTATADGNPGVTSPSSGVTEIQDLYVNGTTADANLSVSYFFAGATTSVTVTGNTTAGATAILVFRGVNATTPIDLASTTATSTSTFDPDPPAITPVTTGSAIIAAAFYAVGLATSLTLAVPTGYTGLTSVKISAIANGLLMGGAYKLNATGGVAENPPIFDNNQSSGTGMSWAAVTLALRPISLGGNTKYWNGSAWVAKPVKFCNGSAWTAKPLKQWNGSAWVATTY